MPVFVNSTGITVDGVALNTVAKAVETKSGRLVTAAARGGNAVVAGRSGSIWTPGKVQEEGRIVLPMWVLGCDDDGLVPTTEALQFYANKDLLQRVFSKRHALLEVLATQPDASVRRCYAECTTFVDFQSFSPNDARVTVELTIPSTYWEDNTLLDVNVAGLTNGQTGTPTSVNGGTAPVEDGLYVVRALGGTITNPRLTDTTTGAYVQYNGVLAANEDWYINAARWISRKGAGMGFNDTGGTNIIGTTVRSGLGSRLLALTPNPVSGATSAVVSGTFGGGATATVFFKGRRKYHS